MLNNYAELLYKKPCNVTKKTKTMYFLEFWLRNQIGRP